MNEVYSIPDQPTETKNVLQNLVTITLRILKKTLRSKKSNKFITLLLLYCRLATVLLYLNEPEKGGETAFPLADNETFSTEVWKKINDYKNIRDIQSRERTIFMTPRGLAEPEVEMSWSASLSSNMTC